MMEMMVAYEWTEAQADAKLARDGYIVNINQIGSALARRLNARAKAGELVKYRGHWNAPFGGFGLGPLKTIWATPAALRKHRAA